MDLEIERYEICLRHPETQEIVSYSQENANTEPPRYFYVWVVAPFAADIHFIGVYSDLSYEEFERDCAEYSDMALDYCGEM